MNFTSSKFLLFHHCFGTSEGKHTLLVLYVGLYLTFHYFQYWMNNCILQWWAPKGLFPYLVKSSFQKLYYKIYTSVCTFRGLNFKWIIGTTTRMEPLEFDNLMAAIVSVPLISLNSNVTIISWTVDRVVNLYTVNWITWCKTVNFQFAWKWKGTCKTLSL